MVGFPYKEICFAQNLLKRIIESLFEFRLNGPPRLRETRTTADNNMKLKRIFTLIETILTHGPQYHMVGVTKHMTTLGRNESQVIKPNEEVKEKRTTSRKKRTTSREKRTRSRIRTREELDEFVSDRIVADSIFLRVRRKKHASKRDDRSEKEGVGAKWTPHRRYALSDGDIADIYTLKHVMLREQKKHFAVIEDEDENNIAGSINQTSSFLEYFYSFISL